MSRTARDTLYFSPPLAGGGLVGGTALALRPHASAEAVSLGADRKPLGEERDAQAVPPVRAAVGAVVELEADDVLVRARAEHRLVKRDRAEVEAVLVVAAGVDPDRARSPECVAVYCGESHRIPGEPPLPHLLDELARVEQERQLHRPVVARRVGARLGPHVEQHRIRLALEHGPARAEVLPEAVV